jgi:hypothetical protein
MPVGLGKRSGLQKDGKRPQGDRDSAHGKPQEAEDSIKAIWGQKADRSIHVYPQSETVEEAYPLAVKCQPLLLCCHPERSPAFSKKSPGGAKGLPRAEGEGISRAHALWA